MTTDCEAENERLEESRPLLYKPYTPLSCRELGKSNKRPCIWHMRESSLNKMIESALKKEASNNLEQMIDKKPTKMSDREFYLSVDNNWALEGFSRCDLFSEVEERILKKVFVTVFDEKFHEI